jgi:membrane associated rhomboid family serine protease
MNKNSVFKFNNSNQTLIRIIAINIIIFIISNMIISYLSLHGGDDKVLLKNLGISSFLSHDLYKPWTIITNMFTHFEFMHIFFNMLYLWWFGKILQETYSGKSILTAYFLGGISGGVFLILFDSYFSRFGLESIGIGASGAVMSIMFAAMTVNPDRNVPLLFIGNIKIKWIVFFLFLTSTLLDFHENTGGKLDHIGGSIFGFLYVFYLKRGVNIGSWFEKIISLFSFNRNKVLVENYGFRGMSDRRSNESIELTKRNFKNKIETEKEIDILLDKVSKVGFKKLSDSEKERLTELSKKI